MKKIATFLIIVGLFSFVCLIISTPGSLTPWFIISPFAVATVLLFLIVQLQPENGKEFGKRKWVIVGGIAGIIGPILSYSPLFDYIWLVLFPFSIVLMGSEFLPTILSRLLLICVFILNIGFYALLGLLFGTIVRGISRLIKSM